MLESLTISDFEHRVGQPFEIGSEADGGPVDTQLVEVVAVGEASGPGGRIPFSLVFRAPGEGVLPQRIYQIRHADLGVFELFLVPIGPDGTGMCYQAVFT